MVGMNTLTYRQLQRMTVKAVKALLPVVVTNDGEPALHIEEIHHAIQGPGSTEGSSQESHAEGQK